MHQLLLLKRCSCHDYPVSENGGLVFSNSRVIFMLTHIVIIYNCLILLASPKSSNFPPHTAGSVSRILENIWTSFDLLPQWYFCSREFLSFFHQDTTRGNWNWQANFSHATVTTHLRQSNLLTCDYHSLVTFTCNCPLSDNIHWTSHGMGSFHWLHFTWQWRHILFTCLLSSILYSFAFLHIRHVELFSLPTLFK